MIIDQWPQAGPVADARPVLAWAPPCLDVDPRACAKGRRAETGQARLCSTACNCILVITLYGIAYRTVT